MRVGHRFADDRDGVTLVEFAVVAPAMLVLILGLLNLVFQAYLQSVLDGAVNDAARLSTLQSNAADQSALDQRVREQVRSVLATADPQFERRSYTAISEIATPEQYEENGAQPGRQSDECFFDYNHNGTYDLDRGRAGQGGADDFVQYTATLSYENFFPITFSGLRPATTIRSTSVLRNQPYNDQATDTPERVCT